MFKKMRFSIPFSLALILFLGLSVSADFDKKWIKVSQKDSKHTEVATEMLMRKCKDCHTSHTEYPFYYNLPFIKDLIDQDIKKGLAYFNMEIEVFNKEFDSEISSTSLNKIKSVLENGSMPPLQYKLMHWDSHFSDTEKKIVTTWIKDLSNSDFIDENEFAQAVVDSDGYGATLNNYDGSEDSISFEGETYYIFYDGDFH